MRLDHRAVVGRAVDRDLEFARQEREFRMQRRPLPQDFGIGAGIGDFVVGDAGVMVRRDVADAIARRLDRVHLDARELGENVGRVLQRRPVVLDVLPGGEMPIAAIVLARDLGELAHLARVQRAVGDRDPQHVGMELQIEPVHEAMRAELLLGQFAGQPAGDLVAELLDPRGDEGRVEIIIMIHGRPPSRPSARRAARGPRPACRDRGGSSARPLGSPPAAPSARHARCGSRPQRNSVDDQIARHVLRGARERGLGRRGVRQNRGAVEVLAPARIGGLKNDNAIRKAVGGDDVGHLDHSSGVATPGLESL